MEKKGLKRLVNYLKERNGFKDFGVNFHFSFRNNDIKSLVIGRYYGVRFISLNIDKTITLAVITGYADLSFVTSTEVGDSVINDLVDYLSKQYVKI
jgi:hypothetical protein